MDAVARNITLSRHIQDSPILRGYWALWAGGLSDERLAQAAWLMVAEVAGTRLRSSAQLIPRDSEETWGPGGLGFQDCR